MKFLRYRLLTVIVIGVITSALSLLALMRVMHYNASQRLERGVDSVAQQVDRLAAAGPRAGAEVLAAPALGSMIGMRGGYLDGAQVDAAIGALSDLPAGWREPLSRVVRDGAAGRARTVSQQPLHDGTLILGAAPSGPGTVAWAGLSIAPPRFWNFWIAIVILLAGATGLLVTTAISAVVSFRRSAAALNRCLVSLADDLSTPVPRPRVRELIEVADGIMRLAQGLAQAREEQDRLGRELSQKERLAALGRVVAGVAHEVRNPLASIKLRLDLAAMGGGLPSAAELAIAHASSEIARLDRLVADLLVVAGRQRGPRTPTSLGTLLRARADALSPWAGTRGVTLRTSGDGTTALDSESVARAIDNLLRNAVEASPRGTSVSAHVLESDSAFLLRVEDSGPGVPSSAELFEPFYTTKPDGTGLGLALSRAIARAHGGDVTYARISHGKGAITRFELSLARAAAARHKEAA